MSNLFKAIFGHSLESKDEIEIMNFGRISDFLMMTSERMPISDEDFTLGQVLDRLHGRGMGWAYELDESYVMCTIDGNGAKLADHVETGSEICVYSRKSIFEP